MANATAIADVSLETLLPMIVLVAVIVYCLAFGAVVAIIYAKYPQRLKQSAAPTVLTDLISFMDCSAILQCLPCSECSLRKLLRSCCPNTESLRRLVNCECIRPSLQGPPPGVDLVCCII